MFRTEALSPDEVIILLEAALDDAMRGLPGTTMTQDAKRAVAERVGGDARLALNTLEVAATIAQGRESSAIDVDIIEEALQRRIIRYDRAGDRHYDVISAFIKSMRGSDPDATMYWLHTMIEAGEDPKFVARRMVIFASEDIGLADSTALTVATDAFRAVEVVGLPEASYAMSHAALYLALAPKSNSVGSAIGRAKELVASDHDGEVPPHLRSGATAGDREFGFGVGYQYPHSDPRGIVEQQYLPDSVRTATVYNPKAVGAERDVQERLRKIDTILGKTRT